MKTSRCRSVLRLLACFLLMALSHRGLAQDTAPFNSIDVNVLNPLQFSYNDPLELLSPKVIYNALELGIKTKQENTNVYAQAAFSGPAVMPAGLLAMRLTSKTSPNAVVGSSTVKLSETPELLFMQPKSMQETRHYQFYYDLLLNPASTMIAPGTYHFSINFTITAP